MNRFVLLIAVAMLTAGAGFAQTGVAPESGTVQLRVLGPALQEPGAIQGNVIFLSNELEGSQEVRRNSPYTATAVTTSTQTLADGNRITSSSSALLARDGQGRTRREETMHKMGALNVDSPKVILINDPVSQTNYVVLPSRQTVNIRTREEPNGTVVSGLRRKLESVTIDGSFDRRAGDAEKSDVKNEDLGMQTIEGLACQGRRETVTIPAGQIGNERPIVITTEIWTSQDLHGTVLKKHTDPRFGETEYRLTNIKLGEPDASLFQAPSGYRILKNEGIFSKE